MAEPTPARVFISYSHDSPRHQARVRLLADRLCRDGVDCEIDLDEPNPPDGWWAWMDRKLAEADFVLVACTDGYYQKATARRQASGHGVKFESVLLVQALYDAAMWNERFIPVLFEDLPESRILAPLRQFTRYRLDRDADYTKLLRYITRQPARIKPPIGPVPKLPPEPNGDLGTSFHSARGAALGRPESASERASDTHLEAAPPRRLPAPLRVLKTWQVALVSGLRRRRRSQLTAGAIVLLAGVGFGAARWLCAARGGAAFEVFGRSFLSPFCSPEELYAGGVKLWQQLDLRRSRRLFEEAIARRPEDWLASSGLMVVLHELGRDKDPEAVGAKRACDHAGELPRPQHLLVTARCSQVEHRWDEAIDAYQELAGSSPDCIECGLGLVRALAGAERLDEALKEVGRLLKRPAMAPAAARLYLAEAEVAGLRSDYALWNHAAAQAAELAERQGEPWIAARSWHLQGAALANENPVRALAVLAKAEAFYRSADDRAKLATVMGDRANVLYLRGSLDEAKDKSGEALNAFRELGDVAGQVRQQFIIAGIDVQRGKIGEAESLYARAIGKYREAGNRVEEARAYSDVGLTMDRQGKGQEAVKYYKDALDLYHQLGDHSGESAQLMYLAEDYLEELNLEEAAGHLSRAKRLAAESGNQELIADVLWNEGEVAAARGQSDVAKQRYAAAAALSSHIGNLRSAALIALSQADLEIDLGRFTLAISDARQALEQFSGQQQQDEQAQAEAVLVLALVARGSLDDAESELEKAERLREKSQNPEVRVAVALAGGRLRAAAGKPEQALRELAGALEAAQQAGLGRRALDVRLALGEIEAAHGDRKHAVQLLTALEDDARKHGFFAVADRAAKARAGGQVSAGSSG